MKQMGQSQGRKNIEIDQNITQRCNQKRPNHLEQQDVSPTKSLAIHSLNNSSPPYQNQPILKAQESS